MIGLRPADFAGGPRPPTDNPNDGWEFGGQRYSINPRYLLTPHDRALYELWQCWRGGGFGGGHLPDAGGVLDQLALTLDAFGVMSAAEAQFKKELKREDGA